MSRRRRREAVTLARWVVGADRRRAGTVLAGHVAMGLANGLVAYVLKLLVDGVVEGDSAQVLASAALFATLWVAQGGVATWLSLLLYDLQEAAGQAVNEGVMRLCAAVPGIEHHERPEYLDRIALVRKSARQLSGLLRTASDLVTLVLRILGTVVLFASVAPVLLTLVLFAAPSVVAGTRARRITQAADEAVAEDGRLADHLLRLASLGPTAAEVRIYGLGEEVSSRVQVLWDRIHATQEQAMLKAAALRLAGWLVFGAAFIGGIALVVVRAIDGPATAGDVAMVVTLAAQVNGTVGQAVSVLTQSMDARRAAERYLWLEDYVAGAGATGGALAPPAAAVVPARLVDGISFEGVSFRYPGTAGGVLHDVDLHLPAGATVALVGENGAGKSTLVKLLCRFYEPTAGRVTVDGTDLAALGVEEWRANLSATFQDFARLEYSVRESVGLGDLPRICDDAAIEAAMARAEAAGTADLDTQLGLPWGGVELSAGQWQRLAVARSAMRPAPLLLLLDEPTAGLDAQAEHALFERYGA
ncbi:MAG: ATP-binding cassette domain-containing protein, partial [Acidimicrobiales bacterium]